MAQLAPSPSPVQYCVISHTHWDREWYLPFEAFRIRLVDLIDRVLEILQHQPEYIFHLDAQTIVLEDYLEIRPHRRSALQQFIAEGRLLVGPWYIQNDFFLTSGESTIRNLLIGSAIARQFGRCANTGYTPDQFGLISQLPQILQGFGIDNCVFGRGYNFLEKDAQGQLSWRQTQTELQWTGADGSKVLGIHMRFWYNNAQRFSADPIKAEKYLRLIDEAIRPVTATPLRLLMNGVDHLEAQEDLLPILDGLNQKLNGDGQIRQTTLEDYVAQVRNYLQDKETEHYQGEMRNGAEEQVLHGTLSARSYLKRMNVQAQALLENCIEPVYSLAAMLGGASAWPIDFLLHLWKLLLQNHPHDSICGCSQDAVHAHMEDRYARIAECGGLILQRGLQYINDRLDRAGLSPDNYLLTIFNTLQTDRSVVITARITLPLTDQVQAIRLVDEQGREIPYEILTARQTRMSLFSPINLPGQMEINDLSIRFMAEDLKGLSYRVYTVEAVTGQGQRIDAPLNPAPVSADSEVLLENEFLQVRVTRRGKVDLLEKSTGRWTRDLLTLEDSADLGTAYNFVPIEEDTPVLISSKRPLSVKLLESTPFSSAAQIEYEVKLSDHLDFSTMKRSEETRLNRFVLTLRLDMGSPRLNLAVTVDNHSKDHRARLLINSGIKTGRSLASTPFDLIERNRDEQYTCNRRDGAQPNSGAVAVSDGKRGLMIFNEGLQAYEHLDNKPNSIALTLMRATGFIFYEPGNYSPSEVWRVKDNQCLREETYRVAIEPFTGPIINLEEKYRQFLVAPLQYFDSVNPTKLVGGRPCVQDSEVQEIFHRPLPEAEKCLPREHQAMAIEGDEIVLSAFKKSESGDLWIVRLFNTSNESRPAKVQFSAAPAQAWLARLDEMPQEELTIRNKTIQMNIAPKKIMTIALRLND